MAFECPPERARRSLQSYIECEQEIKRREQDVSSHFIELDNIVSLLFRDLFLHMDSDIYYGKTIPKHGPGTTADKYRGNAKFKCKTWTRRLETYFPSWENLFPGPRFSCDGPINLLEPGDEIPVRVVSVPKTMKTERIIGIEPTCMQYTQQALLQLFASYFKTDDIVSKFICLEDASLNKLAAYQGSVTSELATLDLSAASDSVSNQLVRHLFREYPSIAGSLDACRSRKADVPGFGVQRLAKFSSMGSAVCFPIECIVFLSICFHGIEAQLNRPLLIEDIMSLVGKVRVFGDDIIVPTTYARSVVNSLQTFGFTVNTEKSFWIGKFRESCGGTFYDGHDVSVVYVRQDLPTQRKHASEIISTVSLRNQFYLAGYWGLARWLDEHLSRLIPLPTVLPSSRALGRTSFLRRYSVEGWSKTLHVPLVRGCVVSSQLPSDILDGPDALLKFFLKTNDLPTVDERHLERAGRPRTVGIKTRWVSPF
jgi:hypothetical protein